MSEGLLEIKEKINLLIERQEVIQEKVIKTEKMVTGNGKIEEGIAFRLSTVEKHVQFVNKFGWMILTGIATIPPAIATSFILNALRFSKP
jgi:hypothetical protein